VNFKNLPKIAYFIGFLKPVHAAASGFWKPLKTALAAFGRISRNKIVFS
jgi:hypothetical protein